ncbi:MAG: BC10 family protein [Paenibacillus macerans]|nr:BC10 family protein [Paenibacillus macerans]
MDLYIPLRSNKTLMNASVMVVVSFFISHFVQIPPHA